MLAAERQSIIVELIHENGSVQVEELALQLNVSPMTIRRDLMKLQEDNKVERCHGGAVAKQEVTYEDKQTSHKEEKKKIARTCLPFVKEGDTVFLDVEPAVLFRRLRVAKQQRPLLANKSDEELMDFICEALQKRHPFYSKAKHLFKADELEDKRQIQASVDSLRKKLNK